MKELSLKRIHLLTGRPGVGKTSIIRSVLHQLDVSAGGFYTEEIRIGRGREGFRIVTLDGVTATLAHVNFESSYRVGKYGVDVDALDKVAVEAVRRAVDAKELVVIDEIGKMELMSPRFQGVVVRALDSGKVVLGTILLSRHPWADGIKQDPRVELWWVKEVHRMELAVKLEQRLREFLRPTGLERPAPH